MQYFRKQYVASVVYWHGERLDSSEPIHDSSPYFELGEQADTWGRTKANTPSPWPGRDYEDHYEVTEYTVTEWIDGLPISESTHRWIYDGGTLTEELVGADAA